MKLKTFLSLLTLILFTFVSAQTEGLSETPGESITVTTYYPSPYGVYDELKANKIILGETAFTSVQGFNDCPEGYEIFVVRWEPKTCSSSRPNSNTPASCTTEKFVWGNSWIPECAYFTGSGTAMTKCVAAKKEYTICVKIPSSDVPPK
ncbi:MAG: hypothetical protein WC510_07565 [Candidatus Omnitrophota bacterium]